ncbi:hypothetical protein ABB34_06340, partial [Stenotrophomonas daejeonensis]
MSAIFFDEASIKEQTTSVRQNAEHPPPANPLAQGAHVVASQGGDIIGHVVTTMSAIEASSTTIAVIISVIEGIASKTNRPALHPAAEPAA